MSARLVDIRRAVVADARAIADVHVATWRATYAGIIAQSYLDGLSIVERTSAWQRRLSDTAASRSEVFVADSRGDILGFIAGGPRQPPISGYEAQLHAIYLRPEVQRQGIGRRLAQVWAAAALDREWTGAVVDVIAHNPARAFYERLGAQHLEDLEVVIGGNSYMEARYGWSDLNTLAAERRRS